jgi:hypothetical protein
MKSALWFWDDEIYPTWWAVPPEGGLVVMWGHTYEYDPQQRDRDADEAL